MATEGYAKVATLMSHHSEFAVLRRFSKLNLQNLLYLQAELTAMETDLKRTAIRDHAVPSRETYTKLWWDLSKAEEGDEDRDQWETILRIRAKLKEYNECLAQAAFLSSLRPPKTYDLNFFREWLKLPEEGNYPIGGADFDSWSEDNTHDLLAVHRRESNDALSRWIINTIIPWFHAKIGSRFKEISPATSIAHYAEAPWNTFINILVTVLASLIPVTSILILYFVSNTLDRLAIAVAFTGLFAFCLALTTKARRVEIFAATSAFAAVQVVFVTGNSGSLAQA